MKFIIVGGASCSGKSAVCKNILAQKDRLFYLSYDHVKWQFSKYSPAEKFEDVHNVMLAMAKALCEMKYDIISDSGLYKEWREKLLAVPRANGYDIIKVNIEADYDVLKKRFDERVKDALANPGKKSRILPKKDSRSCTTHTKRKRTLRRSFSEATSRRPRRFRKA